MSTLNTATAMARTIVGELVRAGMRDLVLSPGSRSAALAFAAAAEHHAGRLRLHTRIDERSAGFLALGLARSSRKPVAVVVTSGTAVANLHPAVWEAHHSGVPLVVLSADRPASLRGTGANQTTSTQAAQPAAFGGAMALVRDLPPGVPGVDEPAQLRAWAEAVAEAVSATVVGASRAPVQLNVQFAPPLVPDTADGWATEALPRPAEVAADSPPGSLVAAPRSVRGVTLQLDATRRTVVVAGDDAGPPARILAEQAGWPLLAEPSSGSRTGANAIRTYRLLLRTGLARGIERVVVAGHPTLSRPVLDLLSRRDVEVVALRGPSPFVTNPGRTVAAVAHHIEPVGECEAGWLASWLKADEELSARLDALLSGVFTGQVVAGEVAENLRPGGLLFVGASNPIRDLDLMVPRYRVGDRRLVLANRGLAGIDGTLSSAIGAALGRTEPAQAMALLGDVTFLHDSNALILGGQEPRPDIRIVVSNDNGGSIFASLEQGAPAYAADFERLFTTPHHVDLGKLCAASATAYRLVENRDELRAALQAPCSGIEVVEARLEPADRRELDEQILALAAGV